MKLAYNKPDYYEIALSKLRHPKRDVDFFESVIRKFSQRNVKSILEIGCGNSPYLEEIGRRQYHFVGLDLNKNMLQFSAEKARRLGFQFTGFQRDMMKFTLPLKVDFAFVLFDSVYRNSNQHFLDHLACVARALQKGSLYVLHMVVEGDLGEIEGKWTETHRFPDKLIIKTSYERNVIDFSRQLRRDTLTLKVNDKGKKYTFKESNIEKFILPQEFLLLVEKSHFEFLEWYDGFDMKKRFNESKSTEYVACVLRKK